MEHNNLAKWSLSPDARQKMVNKIMDTLQKHMPLTVPDGMNDLKKIALRFEEKIYNAAADQQDYLRKISLKMLSLETRSQVPGGNAPGGSQKPLDTGGSMIQSHMRNSLQPMANGLPLSGQSQPRQQIQPNIQNNMAAGGMQSSTGLPSALPSISNISQSTGGQGFGTQSSMSNSSGQLLSQNALLHQRQMQSRQHQQQMVQQHQQSQAQHPLLYQQQQQALLKQKVQPNINLMPILQQQQQQLQQQLPVMQQNQQLPTSQQSIMQSVQPSTLQSSQQSLIQQSQSSVLQPSQQQLQQTQQPSLQQTSQSLLQQHQQSVVRQQQSQQAAMQQQPSMLQQAQTSMVSVPSMQQQQHQLQQLLQSKSGPHQQVQQQSSSLLLSQSQQLQQQSQQLQQHSQQLQQQSQQQQQIISQFQPQSQQYQQQALLSQSNSLQQDFQQRLHTPGGLLQQQNSIEHQRQIIQAQSQRVSDPSATAMEPSTQVGHVDTQEKIYQRLQKLKEMYSADIKDLYMKLQSKSEQHMPSDQADKLQHYKTSLQRFIQYFNLQKSNIPAGTKEEKIDTLEKQVVTMLNLSKHMKSTQQQQGQQQLPAQAGGQVQSLQQQSQSPLPQMQQQDKHANQLQQMNLQAPVTSMQPNTTAPIQHSSMQMLQQSGVQTSQQNMGTGIQTGANLNPTQGTGMGSMQQSSVNSLQHTSNINPLQQNNSAIQQSNMSSLQHTGINPLQQNNLNPLQSNPNSLQNHQQAMRQRQIQVLQQQQQLQRQQIQQQHILQQKQHAAQLQAQFQAQQMPQLQQINDLNDDSKLKHAAMKQALLQQHQRSVYHHQQQQFKSGISLPVSSPQLLPSASPQVSQQSSPQVDQQSVITPSLLASKTGTPLQHATSPFAIPSPSTVPAPSPLDDPEKPSSVISSITNVGNGSCQGFQQTAAPSNHAQSLAIGTPGISASPLLDGFSPVPGQNVVNQDQTVSSGRLMGDKSNTKEPPMERLIKVISSMSPKALASAVHDIGSVVSLIDRMAGSAPGNGSRAAVGEDLVAMTKCRLQARNLMSQDGTAATKKMRRRMSSMPLSTLSSGGTVTNSLQQLNNQQSPEMESTATSRVKRPRLEMSHTLQDELQEINQQLIDTTVEISEDDNDAAAPAAEGRDGIVLKCFYNAVALSPNMKSRYRSSQITPISPLRLLIPADYPNSSPILLDKAPTESCKEPEGLSYRTKAKFHAAVRTLPQPMALTTVVKTWDVSARSAIVEYAHQSGGGSFSSRFGTWESCASG